MYIIARGIIGFGLPYAIVAGSSLIGELAYPKERPVMTSMFNAAYFVGAIVAACVTFGTTHIPSEWSWRIPSLLQMAPSLLQVMFIFFLPESPRFLISKDRHEQALEVIAKYHAEGDTNSELVKAEMAEIKTTIAMELENSKQSWADMFKSRAMRKKTVIGMLIGLMTQLSGNVVISYYTGSVLNAVGFTDALFQAQYNIGNQVWNFIVGVSCALVVMKFKRRTMYLTAILYILAIYVSWTICWAEYQINKNEVAAKFCLL
jgi:MFS family permease